MEKVASYQEAIVVAARKYIGVAYKYDAKPGEVPDRLDCSSFTQIAIHDGLGVIIPRRVRHQVQCGTTISPYILERGDFLFFRGKTKSRAVMVDSKEYVIGHVGIYLGDNTIIHCTNGKGVCVESLSDLKDLQGKRRPILIARRLV